MLFQYLPAFKVDPLQATFQIVVLLAVIALSVTVHEFSHAFASNYLGDRTAKLLGRLTMNPASHIDPLGALIFLVAGFGWGKPVPVNPYRLRKISPKAGLAIVSLSGPISNLITAFLSGLIATGFYNTHPVIAQIALLSAYINVLLAVFNLIPLPPLDGFKVALGLLPDKSANFYSQLEKYGPMPLFALLLVEMAVPGISIIGLVVEKPVSVILNSLLL